MKKLRLGIIGGGLMGREMASALSRWCALSDIQVGCELTAICDLQPSVRDWFRRISTVGLVTSDYKELLASPHVDAVYVAVPHNLHERIYIDVLEAGKDLLAEKPFGLDLAAARNIARRGRELNRFVRCSSEFPFFPGAQRVFELARSGTLGRPLEIRAGFLHSSDLDPNKQANWKRLNATCGEIGVMGDLGMHVLHLPLRLGWKPRRVYAQLQRGYEQRPDGKGGMTVCDTWDNASLHTDVLVEGREIPMQLEMKRLAPGEMNTWYFDILGTERAARFSTKNPKALGLFERRSEQVWQTIEIGSQSVFPTITGSIFETGFSDVFLQMIAGFAAEWSGTLVNRFGCATPEEAVASHELFAAALMSHEKKKVVELQ